MATEPGGTENASRESPAPWRAPVLGVVFIAVGVAFLAASVFPEANIGTLWPLFLLIPVVGLGQTYLAKGKSAAGVLVPLGILLYLTVLFLWLNLTSWERTEAAWPHFLLAPAFGLLLLAVATRNVGLLVPVGVLGALAAISLAGFDRSRLAIALVLIVVGVALVIGPALRRNHGPTRTSPPHQA